MTTEALYGQTALGIMLVLPLFMILLGTITIRIGPKIKIMKLNFPDLPKAWDGLKVLHITDLHISSSLPVNFVEKLVKVIEQANADLIVYTGDILDSHAIRHLEEFSLLKKVKPPLGNYYVPGNHEYYWEIDQSLAAFRSIDFNVLINQVATLERSGQYVQIAGIPDPAAMHFQEEGPDFRKTASHFLPNSFRIMLSHQPSLADKVHEFGVQLQLSGHTHGGQFFPWNLLIGFFQKYPKGLYRIGNMQLYVNQGTGYWGPSLRMGTYCEITEIILRKQ
ncbi:putative metallophosphoesterase [compost metagenome]